MNPNVLTAGLIHDTMTAVGLAPKRQPEPEDCFDGFGNDWQHVLGKANEEERRAELAALFVRIGTKAPASAKYQQVAVSTVSSVSTVYGRMGASDPSVRSMAVSDMLQRFRLSPTGLHHVLLDCGLVQMLATLLLKPFPYRFRGSELLEPHYRRAALSQT